MKNSLPLLLAAMAAPVLAQTTEPNDSLYKTVSLEEVRITTPTRTKMKGNAMVTRIVGTSIASAGNAEDVLARVPGMMKMKGEIEVIGKGTPTYFINGRKVLDPNELKTLSSHDIKSVEVIDNPGALYDAQTNAVVIIRTLKRQGEGFGVSVDMNGHVAPNCGNEQFNSYVNMNYRHNDTDFFGGIGIDAQHLNHYDTESSQTTYGKGTAFTHGGTTHMNQRYNTLKYNFGMNTMFGDNHFMGFKVERTDNIKGLTDFRMEEDVFLNGKKEDHLFSNTHTDADGLNSWLANAYYNAIFGNWSLDWNIDYYHTNQKSEALTSEQEMKGSRTIVSTDDATSNLWATKLILSHPIGQGTLKFGTEMTFAKRNNSYDIDQANIDNDRSSVKENAYALFAEYGAMIPKAGMLTAGLRYEHVDFKYNNILKPEENISRKHDNLFPFLSFATRLGQVEMKLDYSLRTRRPNYYLLRSNIEYNNRYTLTTGNPKLENEIRHDASFGARYKWLSGSIQYMRKEKGIYDWTRPYDNEGRVLIHWINFSKPINRISAFVNASPTIGFWLPNYTFGIQKQWLSFDLSDPREASGTRTVKYNKPMLTFITNNAFHLPGSNGGWQLELNSELLSSAHYGNAELKNWFWDLCFSVQKYFLQNKALSVRLTVSDIFHKAYHNVNLDLGNYELSQTHILGQGRGVYDFQRITLAIRYNLNVVKSKYKGTGAGSDARERM